MFDTLLMEHANSVRNDGMLHFSSALQHDRHAVLGYVHGYPEIERKWGDVAQLITGTAIHEYMHTLMLDKFGETAYRHEVTVEPIDVGGYLWTGTADAVVSVDDTTWLIDYKTTSSNTFEYLNGRPKDEHIMQMSAYYHLLYDSGLSSYDARCGVLYIPTSPTFNRKWADPTFMEFEPLTYDTVYFQMDWVGTCINVYKEANLLPEIPDGEWSWKFDKRAKKWKFNYKPHWSTRFCPWAPLIDDPCGCSTSEIIVGGTYDPTTNEYALTPEGKNHVDSVTKPWELDDDEKV